MPEISFVENNGILKDNRQGTCAIIRVPTIFISSDLSEQPKHIKEALLWHEYGHYYHETYRKYLNCDKDVLKNLREDKVSHNQVLDDEIIADEFALNMVGKQSLIEALNYLKNKRTDDVGIKEIDLRIQLIEKHT